MSRDCNVFICCHGGRERSSSAYHYLSKYAPYNIQLWYGASNPKRKDKYTVMGKKMRVILHEEGYDVPLSAKGATRSTLITKKDAERANIILYMDDTNLKNLKKVIPEYENKFVRLSDFGTGKWEGKLKIPDPGFSEGYDHHREVWSQIKNCCDGFLKVKI